jgi:hypothetical protein
MDLKDDWIHSLKQLSFLFASEENNNHPPKAIPKIKINRPPKLHKILKLGFAS